MGRIPIHYIDVRAFCYATEDEHRVVTALRSLLPEEHDIDRDATEGHHGDQILVLSARVENADGIRVVLDRIRGIDEWDRVFDEIPDRIDDDCSFFLQLDKQAAFNGHVRLGDGVLVRAKIEAYPAKKPNAIENARAALGA